MTTMAIPLSVVNIILLLSLLHISSLFFIFSLILPVFTPLLLVVLVCSIPVLWPLCTPGGCLGATAKCGPWVSKDTWASVRGCWIG